MRNSNPQNPQNSQNQPSQINQIRKVFDSYDIPKNGFLHIDNAFLALKQLQIKVTQKEIAKVISRYYLDFHFLDFCRY